MSLLEVLIDTAAELFRATLRFILLGNPQEPPKEDHKPDEDFFFDEYDNEPSDYF